MTHDPSVTTFWRGCRCRPCRVEFSQYLVQVRAGRGRRVPADDVRKHLKRLPGCVAVIAAEAGVSRDTIERLRAGTLSAVNARTAARILALPPGRRLSQVSAHRTRKLIAAIQSEGWTLGAIAHELHVRAKALVLIVRRRRPRVRRALAAAVEALYQRLSAEAWNGERQQPAV